MARIVTSLSALVKGDDATGLPQFLVSYFLQNLTLKICSLTRNYKAALPACIALKRSQSNELFFSVHFALALEVK